MKTLRSIASSRRTLALALGLLAGAAAPAAAGVYKWVDGSGQTYYGDSPPPGVEATPMTSAPPPTDADAESAAERLEQLKLDAAARDAARERERAQRAEREAKAAGELAEREARCRAHYEALAALQSGRPVFLDEQGSYRLKRLQGWPDAYTGERSYLDDAARAAAIERTQAAIRADCERDVKPEEALAAADQRLRDRELCEAARAEYEAAQRPEARASESSLQEKRERAEELCRPRE